MKSAGFLILALALGAFLAMAPVTASKDRVPSHTADLDPDDFVFGIDNEFFPLIPGTVMFYEGVNEGVPVSNIFTVTHDTKVILGVTTTVVHDRAFEDGVLVEETFDWFAQDEDGNVWYFGEDSRVLDEAGNIISTEGSWEAGVDGAEAGIIMLAKPRIGDRYHQEFAPDIAEDQAKIIGLDRSACVAYGCFDDLLVTKEFTRLNPGVVDHKLYAEGIGLVLSVTVKGGDERLELVDIVFGADEDDADEED